ncbi:hypothetical protein [Rhodobacter lacus]|uniref:TIR domain-containing protein n=1 Tax=Rhodobacter lacus TaxID=1641972 RepID=A0ABW5A9S1_9RHOB
MFARMMLAFTTRAASRCELVEHDLVRLAADLARQGWRLRFAGPRWDATWSRERETLLACKVLVLPDPGQGGWAHQRWAGHPLPPAAAGCQWRPLIAERLRHLAPGMA